MTSKVIFQNQIFLWYIFTVKCDLRGHWMSHKIKYDLRSHRTTFRLWRLERLRGFLALKFSDLMTTNLSEILTTPLVTLFPFSLPFWKKREEEKENEWRKIVINAKVMLFRPVMTIWLTVLFMHNFVLSCVIILLI